ncbi:hypothetical protein [Candidatus Ichthyocystis hellenicum]|uniref:hypothetical protein n=1 Tax=Candidatus Ichthyocystis hellenicum TaxID=1561003 RepID=UPI000B83773D|nr:hypothetical protein [Candidatus Ichthyocystis hellenicum]
MDPKRTPLPHCDDESWHCHTERSDSSTKLNLFYYLTSPNLQPNTTEDSSSSTDPEPEKRSPAIENSSNIMTSHEVEVVAISPFFEYAVMIHDP